MTLSIKSIAFIIAAGLLTACNTSHKEGRGQHIPAPADTSKAAVILPVASQVDARLALHIRGIYNSYLHIQQALVADKPERAATEAQRLALMLEQYAGNIPDSVQGLVYNTHGTSMRQNVAVIAGNKDIEKQRAAFEPLSVAVFELLKFYGSDKPVYQAHCPMAFKDKGASWLSDKAVVQNPYYGDDMLECGEIVAVIRK